MALADRWDVLLFGIMTLHVVCCPFTKVEESFNVQATHDILYHGADLESYDHLEFPGVVPRTFLGALGVAGLASPFVAVVKYLGLPKLFSLGITRLCLGGMLVATFGRLRRALGREFGRTLGHAFGLVTCCQFHIPFYISRPLPNVFALAVVNLAVAEWVARERPARVIHLLAFAAVCVRCDMVLLAAPVGLQMLASGRIGLVRATLAGLAASAVSLALTVGVDSVLWRRTLWPEYEVLFFNTVDNRSSEWGTQAPHWYLTSAAPRALLGALPLAACGVVVERRMRAYVAPAAAFVALYSLLPHKELRFIFPALPIFNAAAAAALARAHDRRGKSASWRFVWLAGGGLLAASVLASAVLATASWANYPGGGALMYLHALEGEAPLVPVGTDPAWSPGGRPPLFRVHIDVLPCMTGVSRFGERASGRWSYSKEEGLKPEELAGKGFTHLLTGEKEVDGFILAAQVKGFSRLRLVKDPRQWRHISRGGIGPVRVERSPQVYIHRRRRG